MAGKGVRVLVTPTSDLGKILACMHGMYFLFFLSSCCSEFIIIMIDTICYEALCNRMQ